MIIPGLRRQPPPLIEPEPASGRALPGDVHALIAVARETALSGVARQGLLLRLSALPGYRTRPHHLRLAREALTPLLGADRARLYQLPNADLAVVWRGEASGLKLTTLRAIRHLFADDVVLVPDADALILLLELPGDAELLLHLARGSLQFLQPAPAPAGAATTPLDPATLLRLEAALAQISVDRFTRRVAVCRRGAAGFQLAWERRCVSVRELAETMVPGTDVAADPWLLRRLTRSTERRLLAMLSAPVELREAGPFSLDLGVEGILAPEFVRFDTLLPEALRGRVVLNLPPEDVLIDPAAFIFARDFAHARGYRLLLSGIGAGQLALLPLDRLGLDLLELCWSPVLPAPEVLALLPDASRVVLARVDTVAALAWGRAHDMGYYQGGLAAP